VSSVASQVGATSLNPSAARQAKTATEPNGGGQPFADFLDTPPAAPEPRSTAPLAHSGSIPAQSGAKPPPSGSANAKSTSVAAKGTAPVAAAQGAAGTTAATATDKTTVASVATAAPKVPVGTPAHTSTAVQENPIAATMAAPLGVVTGAQSLAATVSKFSGDGSNSASEADAKSTNDDGATGDDTQRRNDAPVNVAAPLPVTEAAMPVAAVIPAILVAPPAVDAGAGAGGMQNGDAAGVHAATIPSVPLPAATGTPASLTTLLGGVLSTAALPRSDQAMTRPTPSAPAPTAPSQNISQNISISDSPVPRAKLAAPPTLEAESTAPPAQQDGGATPEKTALVSSPSPRQSTAHAATADSTSTAKPPAATSQPARQPSATDSGQTQASSGGISNADDTAPRTDPVAAATTKSSGNMTAPAQGEGGTVKPDVAVASFGFAATAAAPANGQVTTLAAVAPGPSSAATVTVPVAGLAIAIAARAHEGSNQFDIHLDPPELGRIDVRLDVDRDGQITSHVTVDRPDTLQLLQSQQPQLERALEQAGLKTAENGLQFTLRDQSFSGQNHGGGAQPAAADLDRHHRSVAGPARAGRVGSVRPA